MKKWIGRVLIMVLLVVNVFSFSVALGGETPEPSEGVVEEIIESSSLSEEEAPAEEPTEAPTEEPTEAPTEEPTEAPTEEPTEAPTEEPTEAPTEEPTEAPVEEPTEAPTEEPTEAPTEEPTQEPEVEFYTGYAKLNDKAKMYETEETKTVAYRLPKDTAVYLDAVSLEDAERLWVNYSIDGEKAGAYVVASSLDMVPQDAQEALILALEEEENPVYYDDDKKIPLQEVIPEYPVAVATPVPEKNAAMSEEDARAKLLAVGNNLSGAKGTYYCTTVAQMQSAHPYGNNLEDVYVYTKANAARISITFSSDTYLENGYDFIGIFDAQGNLYQDAVYTGSQLANKTFTLSGDTVMIVMLTDYSNLYSCYGFRASNISCYENPNKPTATPINATSVKLTWNAAAKIVGFNIYRATSSSGPYTLVGTTASNSFTAATPAGKEAFFVVRGFSKIGNKQYLSGVSPVARTFYVPKPTLTLKRNGSNTVLSWPAAANVTGYYVYRSATIDGTYTMLSAQAGTGYVDTGAAAGFYYKVCAYKTGAGGYTYVGPESAIRVAPAKVNLNAVTVMAAKNIKLTWTAIPGMSGYQIYRSATSAGGYVKIGETAQATFTDTNALNGKVNYYRVRAYANTGGVRTFGEFSAMQSGVGMAKPVLTLKKSDTNNVLTWTKVPFATSYRINVKVPGGTYVLLASVNASTLSYTHVNGGAATYFVKPVRGVSGVVYVGPSSNERVVPGKVALDMTTSLGAQRVGLSWAAVPGASGYQILRSDAKAGTYTGLGTVAKTSFTDTSALLNKYGYYKVRAYTGAGANRIFGDFSVVRVGIGMAMPSVNVKRSGSDTIISWNRVANASGYRINVKASDTGTFVPLADITSGATLTYTHPGVATGQYYFVRPYKKTADGTVILGPQSAIKQAPPTYRALLIGNLYSGGNTLLAPATDTAGMSTMLGRMSQTPYKVTRKTSLGASAMLSAISTAFAGAMPGDVSLFYYSGHGSDGGVLVGNDLYGISPSTLRTALDAVPGKKIVIVDACNSGGLIGKTKLKATGEDDFVTSFMTAFTSSGRSLLGSDYYVITAAHSTQLSYEGTVNGTRVGFFTYALCRGSGWDYSTRSNTAFPADANGDRKLSLQEVYAYAKNGAAQYVGQTAQVSPANSSFTLFGY